MYESQLRRKLAREAARLLLSQEQDEVFHARQEAQRRLSARDARPFDLPTNEEIGAALEDLLREQTPADDPQQGTRLVLLCRLMRVLAAFQPRWREVSLPPSAAEPWELSLQADDWAPVLAALASDDLAAEDTAEGMRLSQPLPLILRRDAAAGWSISDIERYLAATMPELDLYSTVGVPLGRRDRFQVYRALLLPLEQIEQDPDYHPEGDALYHTLQVYSLAREALPYDEEFLLAALLHHVGRPLDKQDPIPAALAALDGFITPRTAWFIENFALGRQVLDGSIGARALKRLQASEDYDELLLLVRCDRDGRVPGAVVNDLDDVLTELRDLAAENG